MAYKAIAKIHAGMAFAEYAAPQTARRVPDNTLCRSVRRCFPLRRDGAVIQRQTCLCYQPVIESPAIEYPVPVPFIACAFGLSAAQNRACAAGFLLVIRAIGCGCMTVFRGVKLPIASEHIRSIYAAGGDRPDDPGIALFFRFQPVPKLFCIFGCIRAVPSFCIPGRIAGLSPRDFRPLWG